MFVKDVNTDGIVKVSSMGFAKIFNIVYIIVDFMLFNRLFAQSTQ